LTTDDSVQTNTKYHLLSSPLHTDIFLFVLLEDSEIEIRCVVYQDFRIYTCQSNRQRTDRERSSAHPSFIKLMQGNEGGTIPIKLTMHKCHLMCW